MPKTMFEKIWEAHEVRAPDQEGGSSLLYIDLHLVHEVTSAQAFEGLRLAGPAVRRPDRTLATVDHNVPTDPRERTGLDAIVDHLSREQIAALERNCAEFGVPVHGMRSRRQGIVHVIGPELGLSQPGITIACGDSHTSTHGALGALAMGVGTSEVEHILATQCLVQTRPRTMRITYEGEPGFGVTAKDLILGTIGQISAAGAVGHAIEYAGAPIEALTIEGRMTICNMSIEAGARAGMIAPDDATFSYLEGRPAAPRDYDAAVERWRQLPTDAGATFDTEVTVDAAALVPQVTWGTNPPIATPAVAIAPTTAPRCPWTRSRPCIRSGWAGGRRSSARRAGRAPRVGIHPVGMKNAVMSPHAMNAPMLGITIPARNPPNRWTFARHPPVAAPTGAGIAVDIRAPSLLLWLRQIACGPSPIASAHRFTTASVAPRSREHHLDARLLESATVGLPEPRVADQHVELVDRREPHGGLLVELRVVREDHGLRGREADGVLHGGLGRVRRGQPSLDAEPVRPDERHVDTEVGQLSQGPVVDVRERAGPHPPSDHVEMKIAS